MADTRPPPPPPPPPGGASARQEASTQAGPERCDIGSRRRGADGRRGRPLPPSPPAHDGASRGPGPAPPLLAPSAGRGRRYRRGDGVAADEPGGPESEQRRISPRQLPPGGGRPRTAGRRTARRSHGPGARQCQPSVASTGARPGTGAEASTKPSRAAERARPRRSPTKDRQSSRPRPAAHLRATYLGRARQRVRKPIALLPNTSTCSDDELMVVPSVGKREVLEPVEAQPAKRRDKRGWSR